MAALVPLHVRPVIAARNSFSHSRSRQRWKIRLSSRQALWYWQINSLQGHQKRGSVNYVPPSFLLSVNLRTNLLMGPPIPRCFAVCETDFPASTRSCRAEIVSGCNGGRPGFRPCFLAVASPSFVRSETSRRSNCAMAPKTWNTNSPAAEVVSIRSSGLIRLISLLSSLSTVSSSSLSVRPKDVSHLAKISATYNSTLLPFTSPLGWDYIILSGDFDWHSGAEERQIARPTARQVRQRVRKMSKFAKCSPLE